MSFERARLVRIRVSDLSVIILRPLTANHFAPARALDLPGQTVFRNLTSDCVISCHWRRQATLTRLFRSLPLRSAVATYAELERTCPSTEIPSKHPANRNLAATLCILQFQHHTIVDSRNLFHSHIRIEHQTKTVVVSRGSGQRNSHCPRLQIGWRLEARH